MDLTTLAKHRFKANTLERGSGCFTDTPVSIQELVTKIKFECDGYRISIQRDTAHRQWPGTCSCQEFSSKNPCQHVWATLEMVEDLDAACEPYGEGRHFLTTKQFPRLPRSKQREADRGGDTPNPATGETDWRVALQVAGERGRDDDDSLWRGFACDVDRLCYVLDLTQTEGSGLPVLMVGRQERTSTDAPWPRPQPLMEVTDERVLDDLDLEILPLLRGPRRGNEARGEQGAGTQVFELDESHLPLLLPHLCQTGRFFAHAEEAVAGESLEWDADEPHVLVLEREQEGDTIAFCGILIRGDERIRPTGLRLFFGRSYLVAGQRILRLSDPRQLPLVQALSQDGVLRASVHDEAELLDHLGRLPFPVGIANETDSEHQPDPPRGHLFLDAHLSLLNSEIDKKGLPKEIVCRIGFRYGALEVQATDGDGDVRRDRQRERELLRQFVAVGGEPAPIVTSKRQGSIRRQRLPRAVRELLRLGWSISADNLRFRQPSEFQISVRTGIDWFEVRGGARVGDDTLALPELLESAKRRQQFVEIGDGTFAVLPETWLHRLAIVTGFGEGDADENGSLRFGRGQAWLLDLLLVEQRDTRIDVDEECARIRERLRESVGVEPLPAPPTFHGALRPYQNEGLGWLRAMQDLGLGGCLADDMGLGKTVQVLALLEAWRLQHATDDTPPSLIVAPRSVTYNWLREAERFTPELTVLDFSGSDRWNKVDEFATADVVLMTYGTMRRDIEQLKDQPFTHAVLDESQAIKNATSQTAKAARLLTAEHRLALSGTPIENHLGELWSLFEFLNPGMLGKSQSFARLVGARGDTGDDEARATLAAAMRPFFLRRTKEQVLPDLPSKTEQIVFCEMDADQRGLYDEVKQYYRAKLLQNSKTPPTGESRGGIKFLALEALLRLRQMACHPGLVDEKHMGADVCKLTRLFAMLDDIRATGHKALIFSQFTSLLAIVRRRLDAEAVPYEYLDGRTVKRSDRVDRFQNDPDCPLFLISLKAGGTGLNLTAADYVFLLDPWWNPAAERQAIDRCHRIGQTRKVTAYRLICQDTVEEKVLDLQRRKRELVETVFSDDNAVLRDLTRADLEWLLD